LYDQADAIINTVNTVGVMGKGFALQFKKALVEKGWQYLDGLETGEPNCYAWVQTCDYYNHGGLSLQECLTPVLKIKRN
jgi:hypothetical protein